MAPLIEIKEHNLSYHVDENGNREGEFNEWYDDGTLKTNGFYSKDRIAGEYKTWHSNGGRDIHAFIHDSECHGELKQWDEYGVLTCHLILAHGVPLSIAASTITEKDKFVLSLKYGDFPWLP